ncbi:DUF4190 domain-containing protein [Streptomyces sp. NPDC048577]|uniref:DUF4190 domain-containing protein n=1 Tax=Streptomyces sp. NPDC048577 TaxID=3157209 RepID=UPI003432B67B
MEQPSQQPQDRQPPQRGRPVPESSDRPEPARPPAPSEPAPERSEPEPERSEPPSVPSEPPGGASPASGTPYGTPGPYSPGPYSPGPYGPYGPAGPGGPGAVLPGPYGTPQRSTNGPAVASLVAGVVCCLPPLGLVLGLVALAQIKKKGQSGKGLAVSGIVLSVVSCLLVVSGLVSGSFGDAWDGFRKAVDEAGRSQTAFALRTGQCYDVDGDPEAVTSDIEVVDCARAHEGEVTGNFPLSGLAKWPGDDAIDRIATDRCEEISYTYTLDYWAVPDRVWSFYYYPSRASWRTGDRNVTCTFIVDGGEPLKGSLRRDETTLDAGQVVFLTHMNPVVDALNSEPEDDADEDLAANRAWASRVHEALTGASRELTAHSWAGARKKPVAALVEELDVAAKEWRRLAGAADADAYWAHYDAAYALTAWKAESAAREELGLAAPEPETGTDGSRLS